MRVDERLMVKIIIATLRSKAEFISFELFISFSSKMVK